MDNNVLFNLKVILLGLIFKQGMLVSEKLDLLKVLVSLNFPSLMRKSSIHKLEEKESYYMDINTGFGDKSFNR